VITTINPVGHKYTKEEILAGALQAALADGLSQLTFGRLAKHLGISDRIIVYYFPSKDELISEVLFAMGGTLQQTLAQAFATPVADHLELVRRAWPVLADQRSDEIFALFFEANGLAVAGVEPYRSVVPALIDAWLAWSTELVKGSPARRRAQAEAAIALTDGLLLLRQLSGPAAADRAAKALGVR
jgi:AcrR family transcriptional regulator